VRRWLPILLIVLLLILALSPGGRRFGESLILLADVWMIGRGGSGTDAGARPESIRYEGPGGAPRVADLFCAGERPPLARLLLAHGLVETGKDDERLRALGRAFARHRFLVLVPDFPGMRELRAGTEDIDEVRAAIDALNDLESCAVRIRPPDRAGRQASWLPTGVVGISYSSGPVLLALDRTPAGAEFAVLFGGYYDLSEVILYLTTGRHRDEGIEEDGETLPQGRWVLLSANAATVADAEDERSLREIARRRIADPEAEIGELADSLKPSSRRVLELLTNSDPERFDALFEHTTPALRQVVHRLSPSRVLSRPLAVDLYLLHGRSDAVIPYSQSLKLRRQLPAAGTVRLVLLGGFQHARAEGAERGSWLASAARHPLDSVRLIGVISEVLSHRAARPKSRTGS
jgi:pimeloyl-ACP methyl ester carboxylesterase